MNCVMQNIQMCAVFSIRQKQTRHQYYLQLRRDLLEDRLSCHEETALYLGALALQTEYGDCMPEVVHLKISTKPVVLKSPCLNPRWYKPLLPLCL